jgi:hypothetical protein
MSALELTQIGNSIGVILPKEVLASMNVGKGDTVYLTQAAHAGSRNGQAAGPGDVRVSRCCNAGREPCPGDIDEASFAQSIRDHLVPRDL